MCAIAGLIGLHTNSGIESKILQTMAHRGPDGSGKYTCNGCSLLHSRLAIIDPEGGQQPMCCHWKGKRYVLIYNGELYNTQPLRSQLEQLGHTFEGHSDTEVVLHAFAQWKEESLERMNGIFAFAMWIEPEKKLFLARDRMGVKPLFYKLHEGGLLFASEMKSILTYPTVDAELDASGAAQLLLLGPGRLPGSGVFRDIYEIEPGCYGWYQNNRLQIHRYWSLTDKENRDTFQDAVEKVRYLVLDSIKRQMVSDVPIGTFLSGGLDSSLISAVCAQELKKSCRQLNTFSVDYKDNSKYFVPGKFQPNADTDYIHIMQQFLGTQHHWTVLKPEQLVDVLQESTIARDLPGMADVDFSLLAFCKQIRADVKVALSGECADEIFGGYPWYRDPEIRALEGFPWAQNTKYRASFLIPSFAEQLNAEEFVQEAYQATIRQTDILPGTDPGERRMKEMVNLNYRWFMQTLLDRKDRMSMWSGLEVRVPFCDYRIAEYLYTVPWKFKDYEGIEKGLLRYAMRDILPKQVLWRKKSPYPKTYDPHYMELVSQMLRSVIDDSNAPIHQIVNRDSLESLLHAEYTWPWYGQLMKVPQTIAYMLQINFWLGHYKVRIL